MAYVPAKDLLVHTTMLSAHLFFGLSLLRLPSIVLCCITLVRPSDLVTCPYHFSCQEIFVRSHLLYDGFPHMLASDSVFVSDVMDLSETSKLTIVFCSIVLL